MFPNYMQTATNCGLHSSEISYNSILVVIHTRELHCKFHVASQHDETIMKSTCRANQKEGANLSQVCEDMCFALECSSRGWLLPVMS